MDTSGVVCALVEEMVLWTQVVWCVVVLLPLSAMEPGAAYVPSAHLIPKSHYY